MIQVIKLECDSIEEVVSKINSISIKYNNYFVDYQLITNDNPYVVLLKFDVPNLRQYLELATLKRVKDKPFVYETSFNINTIDGERNSFVGLQFERIKKTIVIRGHFGFKDSEVLVDIRLRDSDNLFELRLYDFKIMSGYGYFYTEPKEALIVKDVEYTVVFENIVRLILERGYLLDKYSLASLEEHLSCLCNYLNSTRFKE